MNVNVQKLDERAVLPTYGSEEAAGMDLYALIGEEKNVTIFPNQTTFIHTGIAMEIPKGYVGLIFARSGLACKGGLAPANKVGVIDSDYRGEIMVALHNHYNSEDSLIQIKDGERIAQMVIVPYEKAELNVVDKLDDTARSNGGFGSTGK